MQGRLCPPENDSIQCFPRENWRDEFPRAAEVGLACIEWIYDEFGLGANPLDNPEGREELKRLSVRWGVSIRSLCADYFMEHPLCGVSRREREERVDKLKQVLAQASEIDIQRVVLPFVDNSSLATDSMKSEAIAILVDVATVAQALAMEIHLETDLGPASFAELLAELPTELIKVNYDSGNSSALGFRPKEEFDAYGERVGSVHIKDRVLGGKTVPLVEGDCDFSALFDVLRGIEYQGDFILQVARGRSGDEVELAKHNRAFVADRWMG